MGKRKIAQVFASLKSLYKSSQDLGGVLVTSRVVISVLKSSGLPGVVQGVKHFSRRPNLSQIPFRKLSDYAWIEEAYRVDSKLDIDLEKSNFSSRLNHPVIWPVTNEVSQVFKELINYSKQNQIKNVLICSKLDINLCATSLSLVAKKGEESTKDLLVVTEYKVELTQGNPTFVKKDSINLDNFRKAILAFLVTNQPHYIYVHGDEDLINFVEKYRKLFELNSRIELLTSPDGGKRAH